MRKVILLILVIVAVNLVADENTFKHAACGIGAHFAINEFCLASFKMDKTDAMVFSWFTVNSLGFAKEALLDHHISDHDLLTNLLATSLVSLPIIYKLRECGRGYRDKSGKLHIYAYNKGFGFKVNF